MPGIAIIKCRLCNAKGPLLRGTVKAVEAWLKKNGWDGAKCPRCVRGEAEGETDLQRCTRKCDQRRAELGLSSSRAEASRHRRKGRKRKKRRVAPRVEVLTETHKPARFRTQDHVEWDAKEYGLGWRSAEVTGVRDKLGKWRYKIRLDKTIPKLFGKGRIAEVEVPGTEIRPISNCL